MFPLLLSCTVTFCSVTETLSPTHRLFIACIAIYDLRFGGVSFYFQGWMNEAHSYDPDTFHPSILHSVYVTLDGSRLHLANPRASIPRWAAFDEPLHEAMFLHSRTYQLANSKVNVCSNKSNLFTSEEQSTDLDGGKRRKQR